MAANAALLDELMGAYRNALPGQREAGEVEWKESNVSRILQHTLEHAESDPHAAEFLLGPHASYATVSLQYRFSCPFRSVKTFCVDFVRCSYSRILGRISVSTTTLSLISGVLYRALFGGSVAGHI